MSPTPSSSSLGGAAEIAGVVWRAVERGEEESAVVFVSVGILGRAVYVLVTVMLRLVTMMIIRYNAFILQPSFVSVPPGYLGASSIATEIKSTNASTVKIANNHIS